MFGKVGDQQLRTILGEAWVNLHCSVAEGWGYSAMEAAACGVPTVAYDVPGIQESVVDGETGLLVPDGDDIAFASAVKQILDHPLRWRGPARRHAERYTWERAATEWESVLQTVSESRIR